MLTNHTLHIVAAGKNKDLFIKDGLNKYNRNIEKFCQIKWHLCKDSKSGLSPEKKRLEDSINISAKTDKINSKLIIALSEEAKVLNSLHFSKKMKHWMNLEKNIVFVIGGAYGISQDYKKQVNEVISLSPMTFNHLLVRLILVEQLYRSLSLIYNTGYHH